MQTLVFNLLCYPPQAFFNRYKSISRMNIAEFLGVKVEDVAKVFDRQDFIDELYREALSALHTHRSGVDEALLASAKIVGIKGSSDRKLYYQLTGAFDRTPKKSDKRTTQLTREEKETAIMDYMGRYGKHINSKQKLSGGGPVADEPERKPGIVSGGNPPGLS